MKDKECSGMPGEVLVVGSVALDTVKTPWGERTDNLGGSATFFAAAASFFAPVRVVGVVGEDFSLDQLQRILHTLKMKFL